MKATMPINITIGDKKFSIKKGAEVPSDVPSNLLKELVKNGSVAATERNEDGQETIASTDC